jgi:DNA repair protein RecO (recombination protein O)
MQGGSDRPGVAVRFSVAMAADSAKLACVEVTQAILIRLTRLSDTSLIVHWFTESAGLVKTVAKGARRAKSPFAGKLDLFFSGEISVARSRKSELHPLREVAVGAWRERLRTSYGAMLLAAYCCQLSEAAVEPEHPEPELYDLLRRALDHIDAAGPSLRALRHFENELARLLGVAHERRDPEAALRDALGRLPATREELLERLSVGPADFNSSSGASG